MQTELLAQVVEEVSILASNRQRRTPRTIRRPRHVTRPHSSNTPTGGNPYQAAMSRLAATPYTGRGARR